MKHKSTYSVLIVIAALFIASFGILVLVNTASSASGGDPLQVSALHAVTNTLPGIIGPALHNGTDVATTTTKCNAANHMVSSHGTKSWDTVILAQGFSGFDYTADNGLQTYPPGCQTYHYDTPMPAVVVARNNALFASGAKSVYWRLAGKETMTSDGNTHTWVSQDFQVLP